MKTNLLKGLGALSLALAMPLFGGAPIEVSKQVEPKFNNFTYEPYEEIYLKISSNADNVIIQNIELNRGNCKSKINSNTSLKSYERKRNKIMQQIKELAINTEYNSESSALLDQIREYKQQIEGIKAFQKEVQKELDSINTYDELWYKNINDLIFNDLDNEGFRNIFNSIVPSFPYKCDDRDCSDKAPEDKELYSIKFFGNSLDDLSRFVLRFSYAYDDARAGWIEDMDKKDYKKFCYGIDNYLVLKGCDKSGLQRYKYYLDDYIKNIIGEKDYNQLTDVKYLLNIIREDYVLQKKYRVLEQNHFLTWQDEYFQLKEAQKKYYDLAKEQNDKTDQYLENIRQKLGKAYLQRYKQYALNLVNLEVKKELSELSESIKKQQQAYPQIQQQEQKQNQQRRQKERKRLTQKLAQLNQKIKNMKEQGNTIEIPLKFGEAFSIPVCDNLKEAKIKTDKGTWTYTFRF
ncbi:hypothetical protein [Helicobacter cetorum]|uniref:hypothetical protein n=1 Tax=Helicobacter cetorum TaxID=138563 RepID=UPI0018F821A6|nr:hypothetical protein [Helicobacter cetorum]